MSPATDGVVTTTVIARLPDSLSRAGRPSRVAHLVGPELGSFLEGPDLGPDGCLYCVDVIFGRVFRIESSGEWIVVADYDGEPNGLKVWDDGRLLVADRRRGLVAIDVGAPTVTVETVADNYDLEPFLGLNDLALAPSGNVYFTDQGMSDLAHPTGRVFRRAPDGTINLLLAGLAGPNGIAVDAAERTLYVAITRANSIYRMSLVAGRPTRVSTFIQLSGGGGPDGIALLDDGRLAVARPQSGCIELFDRRGEPTLRIDLCEGTMGTNLVLGGPNKRVLFITESETATIQVADLL